MYNSLRPYRLQPFRLSPWDFPGNNIGVGCHFFLQGMLPTQVSNPWLLRLRHWQADSSPLSHLGHRQDIALEGRTFSNQWDCLCMSGSLVSLTAGHQGPALSPSNYYDNQKHSQTSLPDKTGGLRDGTEGDTISHKYTFKISKAPPRGLEGDLQGRGTQASVASLFQSICLFLLVRMGRQTQDQESHLPTAGPSNTCLVNKFICGLIQTNCGLITRTGYVTGGPSARWKCWGLYSKIMMKNFTMATGQHSSKLRGPFRARAGCDSIGHLPWHWSCHKSSWIITIKKHLLLTSVSTSVILFDFTTLAFSWLVRKESEPQGCVRSRLGRKEGDNQDQGSRFTPCPTRCSAARNVSPSSCLPAWRSRAGTSMDTVWGLSHSRETRSFKWTWSFTHSDVVCVCLLTCCFSWFL